LDAGWASGPVWRAEEILAPLGIRFLDLPAHGTEAENRWKYFGG